MTDLPATPPAASDTPTTPALVLGRFEKIVAVVLLALFVIFIGVLVVLRGSEHWDRLIYLFGGLEALVFAAVGALFGTGVQRSQTAQAQATAEQEKARADANETSAAHGSALADSIRAKLDGAETTAAPEGRGARPGTGPASTDEARSLAELGRLVDVWFPRQR
ncbi:ABC transporter permease [Actinoplanes xinjiangensis]|uniref:Uncharacterized protein n=1 Tax=Actinoplanes xinjiangensis TaxID=512350 RepID=A0A316F840_9ACTN|nr:ABC transporter permease [Actinoplanes xinjiangensis]PWK33235.1 hypothetical protein BC793_12825 [Actinoplanes xinjiangensis]